MKVILAGSRNCTDYDTLVKAIAETAWCITEVVSGGARGLDTLGERWAAEHQVPVKRFPADWSKHKLAAGPIRNRQMAEYGDALIAVWDGKSAGTKSMISLAKAAKLKIHVHRL